MEIRINKYLSESGVCSRRKADELILAGKITLNGQTIKELGIKVDPENDEIRVDGQLCRINTKNVYYALYKPKGVISSVSDEKGRTNVTDLVPKAPKVYPVGRLDMYSEGLIILTNDGELTQKITHPSFEHEKEYEVTVCLENSAISIQEIKQEFERGMIIDGQLMKADYLRVEKLKTGDWKLITVLHTGFNRQIRKMCDKLGLKVLKLVRIRIGKLKLADLNLTPGLYKEIDKDQII